MNVDSTLYYMIEKILRIDINDITLCFLYYYFIEHNLPTVYMYYKYVEVFKFLSPYTLCIKLNIRNSKRSINIYAAIDISILILKIRKIKVFLFSNNSMLLKTFRLEVIYFIVSQETFIMIVSFIFNIESITNYKLLILYC
ncbi:hypothetical protein V1477_015226 [Vespula maculifrons]|uniref:Uncharacterized protein n=1 Tax=Vespula maculifrons TaxID=7453 RepID=A0ABD2BK52_VESMC